MRDGALMRARGALLERDHAIGRDHGFLFSARGNQRARASSILCAPGLLLVRAHGNERARGS